MMEIAHLSNQEHAALQQRIGKILGSNARAFAAPTWDQFFAGDLEDDGAEFGSPGVTTSSHVQPELAASICACDGVTVGDHIGDTAGPNEADDVTSRLPSACLWMHNMKF